MERKMRKLAAILCIFTMIIAGTGSAFAEIAESLSESTVEEESLVSKTFSLDGNYFNPKDKSNLTNTVSTYSATDLYVDSYGGQLSETQKAYYDVMKNAFLNSEGMPVSNPNLTLGINPVEIVCVPFQYDETGDVCITEEGEAVLDELYLDLSYAYFALTHDYPQLFWAGGIKYSVNLSSAGTENLFSVVDITVEVEESYYGAVEHIDDYVAGVKETAAQIEKTVSSYDESMDKFFVIKEIHDYLCEKITYNDAAAEDASSDMSAFSNGKVFYEDAPSVVCEGYGEAFKVLCDYFDIPCALIIGEANGGAHLWNYVQIDGEWHAVDVTWDDQTTGISYKYFMSGKNEMTSHVEMNTKFSASENISFDYPDLSENYYKKSIADLDFKLSDDYFFYTGNQIKPEITCEGLEIGTDFTLIYKNNINEGQATVEITGNGAYKGTVEKTFHIAKLDYMVNDDGVSCSIMGFPESYRKSLKIPSSIDGYTVTDIICSIPYGTQETVEFIELPGSITLITSAIMEPSHLNKAIFHCYKDTTTAETLAATNWNYVFIDGGEENIISGKRGNVSWTLDKYACKLLLDTTGDMPLFSSNTAPWIEYAPFVKYCEIKGSATNIGSDAFNNCYNLKEVVISDKITTIENNAFYSCERLEDIGLTDNITSIGEYAFSNCESLEYIYLGNNLKSIGRSAFARCFSLKSVHIPEGVEIIEANTFSFCENLSQLTLPQSLKYIYDYAFYDCTSLEYVQLPKNLKDINSYAFSNCNLYEVTVPTTVEFLGSSVFANNSNLETLKVLNRNLELYSETITSSDCTIFGYIGSGAEKYANENGYNFESLDEGHTHTYGEWIILNEPTCEIEGSKKRVCSGCGNEESDTIEIIEHSLNEWIIVSSATCMSEGTKYRTCSTCTAYYEEESIPMMDHTYGEWVIDNEPTCISDGLKHRTCNICMRWFEESIPKKEEHSWKSSYTIDIEPTCTEAGSKSIHCENCTATKNETTLKATGHTYSEWVIVNEPTCMSDGFKYRTCNICMGWFEESIPNKEEHSWQSSYTTDIEPTCTEAGSKSIHCENCDATKNETTLKATGHTYSEWVVVNEPTCMSDGLKERTCTMCMGLFEESIPNKEEHSWQSSYIIDIEPTCTEAGSKSIHCENCDAIKSKTTVKSTGHRYGSWKVSETARVDRRGTRYKVCSAENCESKVIEDIAKIKTVALSYTKYTYNGYAKKPTVTVTDADGEKLVEGTDYSVYYASGRTKVGRYKVTIEFAGDYSGTKYLYFTIVPKAPASASAKLYGHDDVQFSWSKVTGASGYNIYYKRATSDKYTYLTRTTGTSIKKANLTDGVKYTFKVVPYIKVGENRSESISSKTASITTKTLPSAPKTATATLYGYDDVQFSWSKVTGASGYNIYYKRATSDKYTYLTRTTGTSIKKVNLTDGVKYTFKVVPYIKVGENRSESTSYKTASVYTLKKLNKPTAAKSGTKVKVRWNNISGETGYQISRSTSKKGTNIVSTYATTSGTYKTVSATKGKTYYYKVRAYKKVTINGEKKTVYGPWSEVKSYKRK